MAGNKISATAWYAGSTKPSRPQCTFTDSRFASGAVGLTQNVYWPGATATAAFRYFQAMPVLAGDFSGDGDGEFESADLIVALADGGYDAGPRAAVSAVPERERGHC